MRHLLDLNVLLALAWPNHVHHAAAHEWFAGASTAGWLTCSVTESGFIRVSSNHRVTPDARSPGEAALLLHQMCSLPGHEFLVDSVSLAARHEHLAHLAHGSAHITDAHLILLAGEANCGFVTFDRYAAAMASKIEVPCTLLTMQHREGRHCGTCSGAAQVRFQTKVDCAHSPRTCSPNPLDVVALHSGQRRRCRNQLIRAEIRPMIRQTPMPIQ
ncbi:MAG: TA system VapC family ribonuclease toxin [Actinomycetales bacterium]